MILSLFFSRCRFKAIDQSLFVDYAWFILSLGLFMDLGLSTIRFIIGHIGKGLL